MSEKTDDEIIQEYRNRMDNNTWESVLIKDGSYCERFDEVTNLIVTKGKIEFDYNCPVEYIGSECKRKWLHKEFISNMVKIIERNKWV